MAKILMFYFFLSIWTLHTEATVLLPCSASNSSNCTSPQEECSSSHNVCLCTQDYFEDPRSHSCTPMTALRVSGINIENRYAYGVALSWTADKHGTNVLYHIRGNEVGGSSSGSSKTIGSSSLLSILSGGTQYTISVNSVLPADTYYPEKTTTSSSTPRAWTLPNTPGYASTPKFVDWQTDVYDITFGASSGSVSYYTFNISGKGEVRSTGSSPRVRFTNLAPATTYNYTIYAYNGNGDQSSARLYSFITPLEPAGQVPSVSVDGITDQGVQVIWRKPAEPNGNITGYSVFINEGSTCVYGSVITCSDCSSSGQDSTSHCTRRSSESKTSAVFNGSGNISVSVTGLRPYHNYTATVSARNTDGPGIPYEKTFRTAAAVPETVKSVRVTSSRDVAKNWINLDVTWTPGEFTGPTDYIVVVQEETRLNSWSYRPLPSQIVVGYSTTRVTVTNVLAYWRYRVSITTKTTVGISDSYNSPQPIQTESSAPGVVKNIVIEQDDVTAEAMTMTITCPDEKDRNGTVKEFSIKKSLLNSDKSVVRSHEYRINLPSYSSSSCGITVSEIDVGGIVVGQWYSFAVKVINEDFEGSYNTGEYLFVAPRQHKADDDITLVITIAVAGAVVVVLVIIITILIVLYRRKGVRHKKKRKLNTYNTPGLDGPGSERHNYEGMEMSRNASRAAAAAARPTNTSTENSRLYENIGLPREDRSDHESRNDYTVVEDNDYMTQWHYGNIQNAHLAHGQGSSSQSLGHTDFGVYETLD